MRTKLLFWLKKERWSEKGDLSSARPSEKVPMSGRSQLLRKIQILIQMKSQAILGWKEGKMKELLIGKHPAEISNWQRNALHLGFITISKLESNLLQKKRKRREWAWCFWGCKSYVLREQAARIILFVDTLKCRLICNPPNLLNKLADLILIELSCTWTRFGSTRGPTWPFSFLFWPPSLSLPMQGLALIITGVIYIVNRKRQNKILTS